MADYFTATNVPATSAGLSSAVIRAEIALIAAGFAKVAAYTSSANSVVYINSGATAQTTTSGFTFDGTTLVAPALTVTNNATVTGNLAINGGSLTTTALTFNLVNAIATTLNVGGAATTIGIGAATGTVTVNNTTLAAKAITASTTLSVTGATTLSSTLTYGGVTLTNAVTGTGSMVLSASPTLTGTLTAAIVNFSGAVTLTAASPQLTLGVLNTTSGGILAYGSTSGSQTWKPPAAAGAGVTITFPAVTDTLAVLGANTFSAAQTMPGLTLSGAIVGAATQSVFNTVSTTVNAFGAATTLNIGNASGTNTISGATTFNQAVSTAGIVGLGTAITFNDRFVSISGNALASGIDQFGLVVNPVFSSAATSSIINLYFRPQTTAAVFTSTNLYNIYVDNVNKGAGSSITNMYGIYVAPLNGGTTNNYAIYTAGTTPSVFGGALTAASLSTGSGAISGGAITGTSVISSETSSTGTTAIFDVSNHIRPLTSSFRFKKNIRLNYLPTDAELDAFIATNPVMWDYPDGAKNVIGFGAENLAEVSRDLVNLDAEGMPYSNRDHAILAYQHAVIQRHESRLAALETQLKEMR